MANEYKGLFLKFGIEGKEVLSELEQIDKKLRGTQSELGALQRSLKLEFNADKFKRAQELARKSVEDTAEKVNVLKKGLAELEKQGVSKTSTGFKTLEKDINKAEFAAEKAQAKLKEINKIQLDKITSTLDKLSSNMMKSGVGLTAGVTLPLAYVGKQALETASDLTEAQNVIDVSFKKSAGGINTWSQGLLESFGMSELTAKGFAGVFKSMANGMDIADQQGTQMSKTLTETTGDMASFYNVSQDIANTALKSVFTGETESLKQFGVVMTEANLQAFALSQGINKKVNEMTQAEKVTLRYNFVIKNLADVQGDFARTSDSMANQTRLAQERFKALSADLARELLPAATDLLKWTNDMMKGFNDLTEDQKKHLLIVIGLAAALGPVVTTAGAVVKVISMLTVANNAATVSTEALTIAQASTPWGLIAAAVGFVAIGVGAYVTSQKEAVVVTEDHSEEISTLAAKYEELNGSTNKTKDQVTEMKSVEKQLLGVLGDKAEVLKGLKSGTDEYAEALRGATRAALESESASLRTQELNSKQKVSKAGQDGIFSFERKEYIANEGAYDKMISPISTKHKGGSTDTSIFSIPEDADETVKVYGELKEALANLDAEYSRLSESGNQAAADAVLNSSAYKNVKSAIDTLSPSVEEYINVKIKEKLIEEQLQNGIPKTAEEYQALKDSVMQSMGMLTGFSTTAKDAGDSSATAGDAAGEFAKNLKTLTDSMSTVSSAQEELKNTGELSQATIQSLIEKYPELEGKMALYLSGVIKDKDMQDILGDKYKESAKTYEETMWSKMESSEEYYNETILSNQELVKKWADDYGVDLKNFKTIADLKERINGVLNNTVASITDDSIGELGKKYGVDLSNFKTNEEKKLAIAKAMVSAMVKTYGIYQGMTADQLKKEKQELVARNRDGKYDDAIAEIDGFLSAAGADVDAVLSKIDAIESGYTPKKPTSSSTGKKDGKDGGKTAEEIAKEEEEKRKGKVDAYQAGVDETERIDEREQRRKREYGQITEEEDIQITKDRAKRYRAYAEEVMSLDYLTAEEKARIHKEYIEKAEDAELDAYKAQQDIDKKKADDAEEERKKKVDAYTKGVEEEEDADDRYLKNKKAKGEMSSNDELYAMGEKAKRYRERAEEVLTLDYLTEDEKAALHKDYIAKAEEADTEYIEFKKKSEAKATEIAQDEYAKQIKSIEDYKKLRMDSINDALEQEKKNIEKSTNAKLDQIDKEYEAQEKLLRAKIDGIDEEIEARKRLREDEDTDDKLAKINKQIEATKTMIAFERDAENKLQLERKLKSQQQELTDALQDKEDTAFYRQKEDEKAAIEDQIAALADKQAAEEAKVQEDASRKKRAASNNAAKESQAIANQANAQMASTSSQYYNYDNATYIYDNRTGKVTIQGATITSGQVANIMNKIIE